MSDRDIAIHEAGHAIVAKKLGLKVFKVTMNPPGTTRQDTDDDLTDAAVCLAGYQANRIYDLKAGCLSEEREQEHRAKAAKDMEMCRTGLTVTANIWAYATLKENWHQVESVAEALLKRGSLNRWQFNKVYRKLRNEEE